MPDNRPSPHLDRFLQLIVPPEHLPEVTNWLVLLRDFLTGRQPPASVTQMGVTRRLEEYIEIAVRGARELAAARARTAEAAVSARVPPVVGPAQLLPVSETEEITTTQAHDLAGFSAEYWRRLAIAGRIRARRAPRKVWMLNRADVIAYDGRRSGADGPGDSGGGPAGDAGRQAGGSTAGRGQAA